MKALFCIHGILSDHHDFENLIKRLNSKYDYIHLIDLPSHGSNKIPFTSNNTLGYYLTEYDKLATKYSNIDIIGYSLGGVIALFIQTIRPVNKLILLAPALKYINVKAYSFTKYNNSHSLREITPKKVIKDIY